MRGRKPKPTHLHVVEGTLNATRHRSRKAEPRPSGAVGAAPAWMSPGQARVWTEAVSAAPAGLLRAIDAEVLTIWVTAAELHHRIAAELGRLGADDFDSGGKPHPLFGAAARQAGVMLKAASELGFTPASRARVTVDPASSPDPADEFFTS